MTHVETLPYCKPRYTSHISDVLADARKHLNVCEPPPRVHTSLLRSLNLPTVALSTRRHGRWHSIARWLIQQRWSAAVVALVAVLLVAGFMDVTEGELQIADEVAEQFGDGLVPVGNTAVLSTGSTAWLVRTEMSRQQLVSLGMPFDPARAAEPVPAEILLRPNGEVLAIRLVH